MSSPNAPRAFLSYARTSRTDKRLARHLADRLRHSGVDADIDQYHDFLPRGWVHWMEERILNPQWYVLVLCSASYARRWSLVEEEGIGRGVKYETQLIQQTLYSSDGVNTRFIPVTASPAAELHVPTILQKTTVYDVRTPLGYDDLLRRLLSKPLVNVPPVGDATTLFEEQAPSLACTFHMLQKVVAPVPVEVACAAAELTLPEFRAVLKSEASGSEIVWHDGNYVSTTYPNPVHPVPESSEPLSRALDALLAYVQTHATDPATARQAENVLALAEADGVRQDLVGRVFGTMQKPLKQLGDKRLVWRAAELSLAAVARRGRSEEDAKAEALILICGLSWVLQRVHLLEDAILYAKKSLKHGKRLSDQRNTAFCLKCLGRLNRLQAEAATLPAERRSLLVDSERCLREAIHAFAQLDASDRDEELGECHSLLGRTLLNSGRVLDAKIQAEKAQSLLQDPDSKEYRDLQILHGDLVVENDPVLAESFYSDAVGQPVIGDAQQSEIRARALYSRGLCRRKQKRRSSAKKDFEAAARNWNDLQDPNASLAEWQALKCEQSLPIDPSLLESKPPAVRVRVVRNLRAKLHGFRRSAARRGAPVEQRYVDRLVTKAERELAIETPDWVLQIRERRRTRLS